MKRFRTGRWLWVCVLLLIAACSRTDISHTPLKKISVCTRADPSSLDPRVGVDSTCEIILRMLFTGLTYCDQDDKTALALASSYDLSPDRTIYTFHLKKTYWSDGSPLTAADFEETWKGVLDPKFPAPNVNLFYYFKNARAAKQGSLPIDSVGIRALDDLTLQVELEHPFASFLDMLVNSTFYPLHRSVRSGLIDRSNFISCGPFKLKSYQFQNEIVLEKNPYYFDAQNTQLDEIHYFVIKDERTACMLFEKGEIDFLGTVLGGIPLDLQPVMMKNPQWRQYPVAGAQWLVFNPNIFPLSNKKIRAGLSLVINRREIVDNILLGAGSPAFSLVPKVQKQEHWRPFFADAEIEKGKQLFLEGLAEEGITVDEFPVLKLLIHNTEILQKTSLALQAQWKQHLGINVSFETYDFATLLYKLMQKDFHIGRVPWRVQYNDPGNLLELFHYKDYLHNHATWYNAEFASLLDKAAQTASSEERWASLDRAEEILMNDMVICPLYHIDTCAIQQPYLKGVVVSNLNTTDFRWARIER